MAYGVNYYASEALGGFVLRSPAFIPRKISNFIKKYENYRQTWHVSANNLRRLINIENRIRNI